MTADRKQPSYIPIRFVEGNESEPEDVPRTQPEPDDSGVINLNETDANLDDFTDFDDPSGQTTSPEGLPLGGPELAELVASRAELKRLQAELAEAKDAGARRQADFENYRKRIERDRADVHNRMVGDVGRKLLPVLDNLNRALDAERSIESSESKEFRHFLHG